MSSDNRFVIDRHLLAWIERIEELESQGLRIGRVTLQGIIKAYGVESVGKALETKVRTIRSWMDGSRKMSMDAIVTAIYVYPELDIVRTLNAIERCRIEKGLSSMPQHLQEGFMEESEL